MNKEIKIFLQATVLFFFLILAQPLFIILHFINDYKECLDNIYEEAKTQENQEKLQALIEQLEGR